jgi:hypothetical protein
MKINFDKWLKYASDYNRRVYVGVWLGWYFLFFNFSFFAFFLFKACTTLSELYIIMTIIFGIMLFFKIKSQIVLIKLKKSIGLKVSDVFYEEVNGDKIS